MTIRTAHRRLYEIPVEPALGSRFQPTGFPDIGPAEFQRPTADGDQTTALLVESAQSMANRLEGQGWNDGTQQPVETLEGLPYIRVVSPDGEYLTSSRTEAHRLASAFVKSSTLDDESMLDVIKQRLDLRDDTPLAYRDIAVQVMALDPLCLVHGVFFADKAWPSQPKIARALTGFVEAEGVTPVHSGGVKRDHVRHGNVEGGGAKEGYGSIPFHRTEYTARRIAAYFSVDRDQLESYGLAAPAAELLDTIARWEIRSLLAGGMRLRTACDLIPTDDAIVERAGEPLPSFAELDGEVRRLVGECATAGLLGEGRPIDVVWTSKSKKSKK